MFVLPVSIQIAELAFPQIAFDRSVFGQAAELSLAGSLDLAGGNLTSNLEINRLDGPGGALRLAAGFSNSSRQLDVDLGGAGRDRGQAGRVPQLGGGMPLERQRRVLRAHPAPVVGHAHEGEPAVLDLHLDRARAGVRKMLACRDLLPSSLDSVPSNGQIFAAQSEPDLSGADSWRVTPHAPQSNAPVLGDRR